MRITVPNGVCPGQAFQVAVPSQPRAQPPVPMAVPMPVQPFMPNTNTMAQQQREMDFYRQQQQMAQPKPVHQMPQTQQQQKTVSITIPKGCKPGNTITVNLPTGKAVKVTIPHGMHPGNKLTVNCKRLVLPRQCVDVCGVELLETRLTQWFCCCLCLVTFFERQFFVNISLRHCRCTRAPPTIVPPTSTSTSTSTIYAITITTNE